MRRPDRVCPGGDDVRGSAAVPPGEDAGRFSPYGRRIEIKGLQAAGGKRQAPAVPAHGRKERMDSSNRGRRWPQDYCGAFQTMSWTFTGLGISFCS